MKRPKIRPTRRWFGDSEFFFNGYAEKLGASATAIYSYLCFRADNETAISYAAVPTMARETGISRRTVTDALKKLANCKIIEITDRPGQSNKYQLLDTEGWLNPCNECMGTHAGDAWGHATIAWGHAGDAWGHAKCDPRTKLYTKLSFLNSFKKQFSLSLGYSNIHPLIQYATFDVNGHVSLVLPELDYQRVTGREQFKSVIQAAFELCGGNGELEIVQKETITEAGTVETS